MGSKTPLNAVSLSVLLALFACSCADDGGEEGAEGETTVVGDGDGDPATGDGDGDPTTGDGDGDPTTGDGDGDPTTGDPPACTEYDSMEEEFAPIQTAQNGLPPGTGDLSWVEPTGYVYIAPFAGAPNQPASHEGTDYVHPSQDVPQVDIIAAADGEVVYVRLGCPQSTLFGFNNALRECGSGWGNHVILRHGPELYTRYAHMHPEGMLVQVGDQVSMGEGLGVMGNTGRSDERHLHFELGTYADEFDPCEPSQSMDAVYDAENLPFQ